VVLFWAHLGNYGNIAMHPFAPHLIVPGQTRQGRSDVPCPDHEVSKVLAFFSFEGVSLDHRSEDLKNFGFANRF
jgi:hypothetical protein